jgi:hypothetical protein
MIRPRLFITAKKNSTNVQFFTKHTIKHTVLREASLVDEFYAEPCKPTYDKMESVSYVDPIYMLFNQERLNNLGSMGMQSFLESFVKKHDSMEELRKQCSDEDLASLIKSKHLQSPSEISAWCRYMQNNIDEFNMEVQTLIEAQKQQQTVASDQQTTE